MFNLNKLEEFAVSLGVKAEREVIMKEYTTFRIGGEADLFLSPSNEQQVSSLVKFCKENEIPYFILGKGSNILVSDKGIRGAVIFTGLINEVSFIDECTIKCGAGLSLMKLCTLALENSLSGLEFAFGIPGSVGGAAFMNAGAYGGEMKDVLISCTHVDSQGNIGELSLDEMDLAYRHSIYEDNGYVVTSATVRLTKGKAEEIKAKMQDFLGRRKEKQPLEYPSAGSTFKRPEGYFAGALIQECGLKGASVGGAQVSQKHSGFVINKGNATAQDVLSLIEMVSCTVENEKGVKLNPEVRFIG